MPAARRPIAGLRDDPYLQPYRDQIERRAANARRLEERLTQNRMTLANFASGWASLGVRSALVPVLVVEVLQRTELWTGIAFAIAAVAQTLALVLA